VGTAPVPRSGAAAGLALAVSAAAHLGWFAWQGGPSERPAAGSGGGEVSLGGGAFSDLAGAAVAPVRPDAASPVAAAPPVTPSPPVPAAPAARDADAGRLAPIRPVPDAAAPAVETAPRSSAPPVEALAPVRPAPAAAVEAPGAPPALSDRPAARPASVAARAAARAQEPASGAAGRRPEAGGGRSASPAVAQPSRAARTGGATRGEPGASGGAGGAAASAAAAAGYPDLVRRQIARQRPPRLASRGTARVSFTVSGSGGLAALGLAASSGNAALDRAALDLVRRAAPFPPPPSGARRNFTIPVRAR
jgi:protein TonB